MACPPALRKLSEEYPGYNITKTRKPLTHDHFYLPRLMLYIFYLQASCIYRNHLFLELTKGGGESYLDGASRVRVCSHVGLQSLLFGHTVTNLIQAFEHCDEVSSEFFSYEVD